MRCNVSDFLWAKFSGVALAAKPVPTLRVSSANEAAKTDPVINRVFLRVFMRVFMIPPRQGMIAVN